MTHCYFFRKLNYKAQNGESPQTIDDSPQIKKYQKQIPILNMTLNPSTFKPFNP